MNEEKKKKRIAECCPEVMELSFGCEIKLNDSAITHRLVSNVVGGNFYCHNLSDQSRRFPHYTQVAEILGHPITLEHVLKAMGDTRKLWAVSDIGFFFELNLVMEIERKTGIRWYIGKPLEDQQSETLAFLADVLGNK